MDENYSCNLCVKISFDLHSPKSLRNLSDAPSTYDGVSKKYEWRKYDLMSYAIVPKNFLPHGVQVDIYVCMDEDDLDDMDLKQYVGDFFTKSILPGWRGFTINSITEPTDEPPFEVGCPKVMHKSTENTN
ncbi:MAG: hypothetical protein ACHQQQ_14435 [Bacteroidota bacterium]